ncbi:AraC family transcriptional regulator [Weissella paramesenteroides]|jgi:YesN/AraC family two-component response regulator|uniref:AraC family transcriptional regulator n=1 Tax=Weissella paramesenteroides TaxID=1249 RepID=UPI002E7B7449|nr:helix-turn-helix domain-containing protein [Weissella paramesenteroides]WPQ67661.1 helix-turn-helix domain-containing protein [Weissella paramesenteroides]
MSMKQSKHEIITDNADVGVRVFLSDEAAGFKPVHWHVHIEIVIVLEGQVTFYYDGNSITLFENQFIVIGSGIIHSSKNSENKSLVLQIPIEYLNRFWTNSDQLVFEVPNVNKQSEDKVYEDVVNMLLKMTRVYESKQAGYLLQFSGLLMLTMYELITNYAVLKSNEKIVEDNRLKEIFADIHENYREKLTVSSLAQKYHYHPDYLSRYFKQQSGISLKRYVYGVRLNFVHHEVLTTKKTIQDIFHDNGITNIKLGTQLFKEQYGLTPFQLRKQS